MKRHIILFTLAILVLICRFTLLSNELKATKASLASVEQELEKCKHVEDSLSEWDMFTLALMKVESNYEPSSISSVGAKGYFQIMPIYVEEVNRVHKTNYIYDDVVNSFEMSYEVFTLMQKAHNKDFSMDKALILHNGTHEWYHRRVYQELATIKKYEEMRHKVKNASCEI